MTTKAELHQLIDQLQDDQALVEQVAGFLRDYAPARLRACATTRAIHCCGRWPRPRTTTSR